MRSLSLYCHRCWSSLLRFASPPLCLRFALSSCLPLYTRCFGRHRSFVKTPSKINLQETSYVAMAVNENQSHRHGPPYTVFIEGNVGSGKTTFLEHFSDCPNVYLAREPVHKWQDVRGHNFLVSTEFHYESLTINNTITNNFSCR